VYWARLGVINGFFASRYQGHGCHQHERPEAEHHFDFAQQMQKTCMGGMAVRERFKQFGTEGVHQRNAKEHGTDDIQTGKGRQSW